MRSALAIALIIASGAMLAFTHAGSALQTVLASWQYPLMAGT